MIYWYTGNIIKSQDDIVKRANKTDKQNVSHCTESFESSSAKRAGAKDPL